MSKVKILFATVHMEVGGIERTLIGLLNRLDYSKYDVDLLLLKTDGEFINDIPKNVNVITPYKSKLMEKIVNSKNIFCKLIKHTLFNYYTASFWKIKKQYDVAISYSGYYSFIDMIVAISNSLKKFIWVHTDLKFIYDNDKKYRKKFDRTKKKYNNFDYIVAVSDSARNHFIDMVDGTSDKTKVLWNIIDKPKTLENTIKLDGNIKLVSVGRLCDQKRFDKLIEVHKKLIDNNYNVKTYLIGDGESREQLSVMIKEKNIEDTFIMLGKQMNVIDIVKQADYFISTSDYEGLPTVLIETLICGVGFIGTNVCGTSDVAKKIAPKNSYILTDNNVDSIYSGVVDAINGKIDNNFKFDLDNYNNNAIKRFEDLINESLK